MNIRRFRTLHAAGATFAEIGRECGCDWRTVRKYLAEDAVSVPPAGPSRTGTQPLLITPFIGVVEGWLRADLRIKGTVVHERLVAEYGFTGNYQRVKMFLAEARPRIAAELAEADENRLSGLHRRFEVVPGAQAQVDWAMRVTCWPMSASRTCTPSTWCSAIRGTRFAVSPPAWIWPRSGTATGGGSRISAACPARSSTTAPRP